jgi:hypothetical protein
MSKLCWMIFQTAQQRILTPCMEIAGWFRFRGVKLEPERLVLQDTRRIYP